MVRFNQAKNRLIEQLSLCEIAAKILELWRFRSPRSWSKDGARSQLTAAHFRTVFYELVLLLPASCQLLPCVDPRVRTLAQSAPGEPFEAQALLTII